MRAWPPGCSLGRWPGSCKGPPNMAALKCSLLGGLGGKQSRLPRPSGRKALALPGEGSLSLVPPQRGFPLIGNSGLSPRATLTELPQIETSCLGSQGLLAMGLFMQALLPLGPWGLVPWCPPSLLLQRKWLFPSNGPVSGPTPSPETPSLGGSPCPELGLGARARAVGVGVWGGSLSASLAPDSWVSSTAI